MAKSSVPLPKDTFATRLSVVVLGLGFLILFLAWAYGFDLLSRVMQGGISETFLGWASNVAIWALWIVFGGALVIALLRKITLRLVFSVCGGLGAGLLFAGLCWVLGPVINYPELAAVGIVGSQAVAIWAGYQFWRRWPQGYREGWEAGRDATLAYWKQAEEAAIQQRIKDYEDGHPPTEEDAQLDVSLN